MRYDNTPGRDERGPDSQPADAGYATLTGMDPRWQLVHDRFREGYAAAALGRMEAPEDRNALALLKAAGAALRTFGLVYQEALTQGIARQIDGLADRPAGQVPE